MNSLLFSACLLVVVIFTDQPAAVSAACPAGSRGSGTMPNVCFSISNMKATWVDAMAMCKIFGGYLADINSDMEQIFVEGLANRVPGLTDVWIGGTDAKTEGTWVWSHNGRRMSYTKWNRREPNNSGGSESCLHMSRVNGYRWNDTTCYSRWNFVCKYRSSATPYIRPRPRPQPMPL